MPKSIQRTYSGYSRDATVLLGVTLFESSESALRRQINQTNEKLSLLPKSIRKPTKAVHDDF